DAFKGCIGFKTLVIRNGVSNTSLNTIGESAFEGCKFDGDLAIPNSVTTIGTNAFNNCYTGNTGSLTLGKGIKTIGQAAFYGCSAFNNQITLPDSLITIERYAFQNCTGLTGTLNLPDNITTVGPLSFAGCPNITIVSIPSSANVSGGAFDGCTGLTRISAYPGSTIDANAFPAPLQYWKTVEGQPVPVTCGDKDNFIGYEFTRVAITVNDFNRTSALYSWKVTYDPNGGAGDVPVQGNVRGYSTFTVQGYNGTKEGHVFVGWEYQHVTYKPGDSIRMLAEDMILVAVWSNLYNIVYDVDGGSAKAPVQDPLVSGVTFRLKEYTGLKFGYQFGGWEYNGKVYPPGTVLIVGKSDILLIAVWKTLHEVVYNIDGGSGDAPEPKVLMEGDEFTVSSYSGTKDGFKFDGWLFDGKVYQPNDTIVMGTKDIVLLANWSKIHHVKYDINGGTGEVPIQEDVAEGDTFTIKECTATKKGYWLDGWIYINDVYHAGDVITMGTSDITLTANWKEGSPSHHVKYDINGGSGIAPVQADVEEGSTFTIKYYSGTKDSYDFKGWSYGGKTYQLSDKVIMGKEDIVLKAVWEVSVPDEDENNRMTIMIGVAIGLVVFGIIASILIIRRR
ncbi:MAG: InlB B-repeat-containing protein, partial [Candidatus Methanomethylophilaceae archaeon]|nr:InlB B-repeat-containing protein [Candidatus Methanomethylophilaceae archaeon]